MSQNYDGHRRDNESASSPNRSSGQQSRTTRRTQYTDDRPSYRNANSSQRQQPQQRQPGRQPRGYTTTNQEQIRAYGDYSRYSNKQRPRKETSALKPVLLTIALFVVLGIGIFAYMQTLPITITVNGEEVSLGDDKNIETILAEKHAKPEPGDFVDVEGEVITPGEGEKLRAIVNGEETKDLQAKLKKGDEVVIENGANKTEPSQDTSEEIPWEYKVEGNGPLHVTIGGKNGVRTTKVGEISGKTYVDETSEPVEHKVCKKYYPDVGDDKVIALTIDDGPWPETTEAVLDVLKENDVKATFFVLGFRVAENQALVKRAHDEGNQIATHTWDHADGSGQGVSLDLMPADEQRDEVTKGYQSIKDATGEEPSAVFRAPGGNYTEKTFEILSDLVKAEIGWTIDTEDWRQPGKDAIVDQMKGAKPGSVILCHDGGGDRKQTVEALKEAIPYLKEKGFRFVTIDELLEYPPLAE